jgi:hypothetical protein
LLQSLVNWRYRRYLPRPRYSWPSRSTGLFLRPAVALGGRLFQVVLGEARAGQLVLSRPERLAMRLEDSHDQPAILMSHVADQGEVKKMSRWPH